MKTSSKKLDKCQVRLSVALDEGEMNSVVREVENVFMREAQMPGFGGSDGKESDCSAGDLGLILG